ncbi:MAG: aminotransferase class I/II-fold pyridoxal phosphate-dependent enzyme, partial [Rhodobacteraceae bacterium]
MTLPRPYLDPMPVRGRIATPQPRGLPVINLGYNELPYDPGPAVAAALADAGGRANRYGSPHCDALREAIGARFGLDPAQILCGNGSEEVLDVIARVFARPGDEILISQFGYIQFALTANRQGATLVKAPERNLTTDPDALATTVTDRTRVIFLANPNNPTGTMVPVESLARLAAQVPGHVVLVLDLAYGEFAGAAYCAAVHDLVAAHPNVVVTRTFSKAYGLAGARVGWCHAAPWMIPHLYAARGMGTVNALAQAAAIAALSERALVEGRVAETVAERERMAGVLRQRGVEVAPSHANFLMIRPSGEDAAATEALVQYLFDEGG